MRIKHQYLTNTYQYRLLLIHFCKYQDIFIFLKQAVLSVSHNIARITTMLFKQIFVGKLSVLLILRRTEIDLSTYFSLICY